MTRPPAFPSAPLAALDTLWIQVAGTLCNLACTHCFISCSPTNHAHEMMTLAQVLSFLRQAERIGVKEYYLTGGEPFMNPEILPILEAVLTQGPAAVLTNGLLIRQETAGRLRRLSDASEYSLDLRVSLDGYDAASNDAVRGEGTFSRILAGIGHLAEAGLSPVITVTEACEGAGTQQGRGRLLRFLGEIGLTRPRLKVMPLLRLGAEQQRSRPYDPSETLAGRTLSSAQLETLQCTSCRMVTSRGVWVCPILLDAQTARLGSTLEEAADPFTLSHAACHTCVETGFSCRT